MTAPLEQVLASLLETIEPPAPTTDEVPRFQVREIPGRGGQYVGRNSDRFPCLLLKSRDTSHRAPIRLATLDVRFTVNCSIINDKGSESRNSFNVVVCTSNDRYIQRYFSYAAATLLNVVGLEPTNADVSDAIQYLIELFRAIGQPARKTVIGLMGELYLILISKRPDTAIRAWRSGVDDRFDFSVGNARLEVKSSSNRSRSHSFSLEQTQPPAGTCGVLASMFIEVSGAGLSLLETIRKIENRVNANPELQRKLNETVAQTLGATLPSALDICFDEHLASSSLRLYDLETIPAIRTGVPRDVTQVKFTSNLEHNTPMTHRQAAERSERVADMLPLTDTN